MSKLKHHNNKPVILKNWKTGKLLKSLSGTRLAERLNVSPQVICDIMKGRRKNYGSICLPKFSADDFFKVKVKNLMTGRILKFRNYKLASKILKISTECLKRINTETGYHKKHYGNVDFNGNIPVFVNKSNGSLTPVFSRQEFLKKHPEMSYRYLHYFFNQKRIKSDDKFYLNGHRSYKYLIMNKQSGKKYHSMNLSDFARKRNLDPHSLHISNNDTFEVLEG